MVMIDEAVTQAEFAALVGISQPAVAGHVQSGVLVDGATCRDWLLAYCDRLRLEASGRARSIAAERRDNAIARQAEVKAQLDERELYRQDGLILDTDSVRQAMADWATVGKNEFLAAVDNIVTAIESTHGITIERSIFASDIDAALRAIGSYEVEPVAPGDRGTAELDTAA